MKKSIRMKENVYLDSSGVIHNKELLCDILNSQLVSTGTKSYNATNGQNNYINSISIGKGVWIVIGEWRYEGFELSSWTTLIGTTFSGASSKYDDNGYVNDQIVGILINTSSTKKTINLNLWPRGKSITVTSTMCAIRIR